MKQVKVWFQNRRMKWKRARGVGYPKASGKSKSSSSEFFDSANVNDEFDDEDLSEDEYEDEEEDEEDCDGAENETAATFMDKSNQIKQEIN